MDDALLLASTWSLSKILRSYSKPQLVTLCMDRHLSTEGLKKDLAKRFYQHLIQTPNNQLTKTTTQPIRTTTTRRKIKHVGNVWRNTYRTHIHVYPLSPYNHYLFDPSTQLMMDPTSHYVVGRWDPTTHQQHPLRRQDMDLCKELKLVFDIPDMFIDERTDGLLEEDTPTPVDLSDNEDDDEEEDDHTYDI